MRRYKNILIGVDLYEGSDAILEQAKRFANNKDASYHLVHVYPYLSMSVPYAGEYEDELIRSFKTHLTTLKANFNGSTIHTHLRQGSPKLEIVALAEEVGAQLIVLGSHGKHGVDLLLGSTANGVLHRASCDVLTVRVNGKGQHKSPLQYKNVLLATDFEPGSEQVADVAKRFCDDVDAQLHVLSVLPEPAILPSMYEPAIDVEYQAVIEKKMETLISTLSLDATKTCLLSGTPKHVILAHAKKMGADLIVLGTHGKPLIASAILGSTAHAVLHGAEVDVFLSKI